jgi:hypothetical protein
VTHAGNALAEKLRKVATGEIATYDFSPMDWRPGAIPLLLWEAAEEIERLIREQNASRDVDQGQGPGASRSSPTRWIGCDKHCSRH